MERWSGKVAVVTGASRGIGAAICKFLVSQGLQVVGLARNVDKMTEDILNDLPSNNGTLKSIQCDVTKDDDVKGVFNDVIKEYGGIDILINNAAVSSVNGLLDSSPEEMRRILDLNVVALVHCTNLAVASMSKRGTEGHIVNISSIAAHTSVNSTPFHVYCATKHAVRSISEGLRHEIMEKQLKIRISCISPGLVNTTFPAKAMGIAESELAAMMEKAPNLAVDDVAQCLKLILGSPPTAEINDILLRPKGSPF